MIIDILSRRGLVHGSCCHDAHSSGYATLLLWTLVSLRQGLAVSMPRCLALEAADLVFIRVSDCLAMRGLGKWHIYTTGAAPLGMPTLRSVTSATPEFMS
jgi:hypothetical protein